MELQSENRLVLVTDRLDTRGRVCKRYQRIGGFGHGPAVAFVHILSLDPRTESFDKGNPRRPRNLGGKPDQPGAVRMGNELESQTYPQYRDVRVSDETRLLCKFLFVPGYRGIAAAGQYDAIVSSFHRDRERAPSDDIRHVRREKTAQLAHMAGSVVYDENAHVS